MIAPNTDKRSHSKEEQRPGLGSEQGHTQDFLNLINLADRAKIQAKPVAKKLALARRVSVSYFASSALLAECPISYLSVKALRAEGPVSYLSIAVTRGASRPA